MNDMIKEFYTNIVRKLPKAKVPISGVQGWVFQGQNFQLVFFEIEKSANIPPHSHEAQFGMLIDGKGSMTIDGTRVDLIPGTSYFIRPGAVHEASFDTFSRVMDIFMEKKRYETED